MHKSICYHTRLSGKDSVKVCGGSFGGQVDMETVEQLVKNQFTVVIKNSGHAVFVDKEGREVNLYINIDPLSTKVGKDSKAKHNKETSERIERDKKIEAEKRSRLEAIMENMTNEEIIEKLTK